MVTALPMLFYLLFFLPTFCGFSIIVKYFRIMYLEKLILGTFNCWYVVWLTSSKQHLALWISNSNLNQIYVRAWEKLFFIFYKLMGNYRVWHKWLKCYHWYNLLHWLLIYFCTSQHFLTVLFLFFVFLWQRINFELIQGLHFSLLFILQS